MRPVLCIVSRSLLGGMVVCVAFACHRSGESRREASGVAAAKGPVASSASEPGRLDAHRSFGAEIAVDNLQVWPIVSDVATEVGPYLTLQEAQAKGVAKVRELEQGAEVNQLVVENGGDLPILVCAGTLVKGGQQDRQIGQDFIVLAKSTVPVDVFCVEQGRWTGATEAFDVAAPMALASIRASAQYGSDQGEVWKEVGLADRAAGAEPASGTLLAAFAVTDPEIDAGREKLEKSLRASFDELLTAKSAVVGFAYAIDGKPVTVRTFADPRLLKSHLDPFVRTMAMEAQLADRGRNGASPRKTSSRATIDDVLALVRAAGSAPEETVTTKAGNVNCYRKAESAASSACFLGSLGLGSVAITEDWTARTSAPLRSRIEGPSDTQH